MALILRWSRIRVEQLMGHLIINKSPLDPLIIIFSVWSHFLGDVFNCIPFAPVGGPVGPQTGAFFSWLNWLYVMLYISLMSTKILFYVAEVLQEVNRGLVGGQCRILLYTYCPVEAAAVCLCQYVQANKKSIYVRMSVMAVDLTPRFRRLNSQTRGLRESVRHGKNVMLYTLTKRYNANRYTCNVAWKRDKDSSTLLSVNCCI